MLPPTYTSAEESMKTKPQKGQTAKLFLNTLMTDNRDSLDFRTEPVGRLFRRMFLPTLVGMVSMVILNITDGAFVGHGVGSDALAAVNIVAPLFLIMAGIGLMFGIGSSVVASIHMSKGNQHAADINLTQGILASLITGTIVGSLVFTFQEETCRLFGCSDLLLPQACSYLRWIAIMMPFNLFGMTAMFMVRLDGSPRFAMIVNCGMAALNILLDYILIFPMHLGLEGAAIATSTAFSLGNIPIAIYLLRHTNTVHLYPIKLTRTSLILTLRNIVYQIKIGFSALLGELAIASVIIVGNYVFMRYLGEDGVAAYSVGCYCLPIVFMMGNAIVQSVQPIISFAYGANDTTRLEKARAIALRTAILSGIIGMLFMAFGSDTISGIFLRTDCNAYQLCCEGLLYYSPAFLFIAVNIALIGYMQSIEATRPATVFTLMRGFMLSIPCFILLPLCAGIPGLWLAQPTAEAITLAIILFIMKK